MGLFRGKWARKDAVRGSAPIDGRKVDAGLLFPAVVGTIEARVGVLAPGDRVTLVEGTGTMAYAVWPATFVTSRGVSDGVQVFGNDAYALTPSAPAAPSLGLSRIDIIWVRHPTNGENSDTSSEPEFGVSSGVAASVPVPPTIPTGALELGRNTMTSAATTTGGVGNSIQQTFQRTSLRGVPLPVRSQAERDELAAQASVYNPVRVVRADAGGADEVNRGAGWMRMSAGLLSGRQPITTVSAVNPDTALTSVVTVPALPIQYRVIVTAMGRSGGAPSVRQVAWEFDSHPVGATVSSDSGGTTGGERATAPADGYATVVSTEEILCPANVACTFRVMYRGSNNAFNRGSVVWHREPLA